MNLHVNETDKSEEKPAATQFVRVYESNRDARILNRLSRSDLRKSECDCQDEEDVELPEPLFADSSASLVKSARVERKVLVMYTGGTIGMIRNSNGEFVPSEKGQLEARIRGYPQLHDQEAWRTRIKDPKFDRKMLILPPNNDMKTRILYKLMEFDELLDSSNMNEEDWIKIASEVNINYGHFDGFVILHGTDTIAYTASALSFMFENIGKPVILTGSMRPIFDPRSYAADNIVHSLTIAGSFNIPEVTIFFATHLLRGNRCRHYSSQQLNSFKSPNFDSLITIGLGWKINKRAIFYPNNISKFKVHLELSRNVAILRLFPCITADVIRSFCKPPIEGIVLQSYGSGNAPSNRPDIDAAIIEAVNNGVIMVNITQCLEGTVMPIYETGKVLLKLGVVQGYDMTPEAALAKLSYVLSKPEWTLEQKKELMATNMRGELTSNKSAEIDHTLADALIVCLNITSPKKLQDIIDEVYQSLLMYAIEREDSYALRKILGMGADVNNVDTEGRSPLHFAVTKGNHKIVEYLLDHGANINIKSKRGDSPYLLALQSRRTHIIEELKKRGANLYNINPTYMFETLASMAMADNVEKLSVFKKAGVDLGMTDTIGQTPLHKAVICNSIHAVRYLWDNKMGNTVVDLMGHKPEDYARILKREEILAIFTQV